MFLRRRGAIVTTATCLFLAATGSAHATAGELDTSYGNRGAAIANFGHSAYGNSVLVQPDGKVLVTGAGFTALGATNPILARFTGQGELDSSFGNGTGIEDHYFGVSYTSYGSALQPDGKIVLAGDTQSGSNSHLFVARFGETGVLDTSFGGGTGTATPEFGGNEYGRAMALDEDGEITLAGYQVEGKFFNPLLARLTPTGSPDKGFHETGVFVKPQHTVTLAGVALTSSDVPIGVGQIGLEGESNFGLENPATNPNGIRFFDFGGQDAATAIAIQPNGKIVMAGYTDAKGSYDFAVARVGTDEHIDPSFGNEGKTIVDLGSVDTAKAIALQPDGKILVAGTTGSGSDSSIGVVRLLPSGQLDPTFGNGGISIVTLEGALQGESVALQADGKIVVGGVFTPAGSSQKDPVVVRLLGDPHPSTGGGSGGGSGGGGGGGGDTGASVPSCQGHRATIVGTAHADRLNGTAHADVIVALGGNDTINGKGGNDIVCAGAGNDHLIGGAGNDRLYGQEGADTIEGGEGKDLLEGGKGSDHLSGGPGKDVLKGAAGNDSLNGGGGKDQLSGGLGHNTDKQ